MDEALIQLIKQSDIFADYQNEELQHFIRLLDVITLSGNEILFEQGVAADGMYVLLKGLLIVTIKNAGGGIKTIGYVKPGQTVGEMGLITLEPRASTVKALHESTLLKITSTVFEHWLKSRPDFLLRLLTIVIQRAKNTIEMISDARLCRIIGLVSANASAPLAPIRDALTILFSTTPACLFLTNEKLTSLKTADQVESLFNGVAQTYDMVLCEIDIDQQPFASLVLEKISRLFIIADGKTPPRFSLSIKNILYHPTFAKLKKDLVLCYEKRDALFAYTRQWLESAEFTTHHHLFLDQAGYHYLMRYMRGTMTGLVLSGGGVKGWVHVGVMKALLESGQTIDAIGGTSIGAIVGAAYLIHDNYENFYHAIYQFSRTFGKVFSLRDLTFPLISLLNGKRRTRALQDLSLGLRIENFPVPFFCVSANLSDNVEVIHHQGSLWQWLCASSALPGLFPPIAESGKIYLDGGVVNNLPVDVMRNRFEGHGKIIAVDLSLSDKTENYYAFPPIINFFDAFCIKFKISHYRRYNVPSYAMTLLESLLMGAQRKTLENLLLADVVIRPDLSKYKMTGDTLAQADELIAIGYNAMKKQIKSGIL